MEHPKVRATLTDAMAWRPEFRKLTMKQMDSLVVVANTYLNGFGLPNSALRDILADFECLEAIEKLKDTPDLHSEDQS